MVDVTLLERLGHTEVDAARVYSLGANRRRLKTCLAEERAALRLRVREGREGQQETVSSGSVREHFQKTERRLGRIESDLPARFEKARPARRRTRNVCHKDEAGRTEETVEAVPWERERCGVGPEEADVSQTGSVRLMLRLTQHPFQEINQPP